MTNSKKPNTPAAKINTQGLSFERRLSPWDKEFPDSPMTAFRLWILRNYTGIFHEESVRRVERAFDAC